MSLTMIIALVVAFVGIGMAGTIRIQHADNKAAKAETATAKAANLALAQSISGVRAQCDTTRTTMQATADNFKRRALTAEKLLATNKTARAAEQPTLDRLEAQRVDATPKPPEESCAEINGIIDQWVTDSLRQ